MGAPQSAVNQPQSVQGQTPAAPQLPMGGIGGVGGIGQPMGTGLSQPINPSMGGIGQSVNNGQYGALGSTVLGALNGMTQPTNPGLAGMNQPVPGAMPVNQIYNTGGFGSNSRDLGGVVNPANGMPMNQFNGGFAPNGGILGGVTNAVNGAINQMGGMPNTANWVGANSPMPSQFNPQLAPIGKVMPAPVQQPAPLPLPGGSVNPANQQLNNRDAIRASLQNAFNNQG